MPVFDPYLHKQIRFVEEYIKNGFHAVNAAIAVGDLPKIAKKVAYLYLKKPYVREQLEKQLKRMQEEHGVTFDWKVKKLKKVVNVCIPDEAETRNDIDPDPALKAIGEMNKMQGHYQPESTVNTNVHIDTDIQDAQQIMDDVIERHKKDY